MVLDTHVLLWWKAKKSKLSRESAKAIQRAERILVSAVSCWELATLVTQGRVKLDRSLQEWVEALEAEENVQILPLTARVAVQIVQLDRAGFHGDPADRLIYATALDELASLITADERIHQFASANKPSVRVIW